MLNDEKTILLRELESKDKIIKGIGMNNTRYMPHTKAQPVKHKVIASADNKKKGDRRRKEEQIAQLVPRFSHSYRRKLAKLTRK